MPIIKRTLHLNVWLLVLAMLFPHLAAARDSTQNQPIADAMKTVTAKGLDGVKFYFGEQSSPPGARLIGTYSSRKATNAFNKSDYEACQWAFLSALKSLHQRALGRGGNAVVNIRSLSTGQLGGDADNFVCRAGNVVAKVYLRGDVVALADH